MNAIPTVYNGIQFRSRLEAKWAAFFDSLDWHWEYEPFDLAGWIPDFLLPDAKVLVEVKPTEEFPEHIGREIKRVIPEEYESLILGCMLPISNRWLKGIDPVTGVEQDELIIVESSNGIPVGWMLGRPLSWQPVVGPTWGIGCISQFEHKHPIGFEHIPKDTRYGLFHSHDPYLFCDPGCQPTMDNCSNFYHNRFCWSQGLVFWSTSKVAGLWRNASNQTQWKGKQSVCEF